MLANPPPDIQRATLKFVQKMANGGLVGRLLAGLGFTRLYSMEGGIIQWAKKVDPSMPVY